MAEVTVREIGKARIDEEGFRIELDAKLTPALRGLSPFGHIQILWWFSGCDDAASRSTLVEEKPYVKGPQVLGVFATRSPLRPNPLALSCAAVTYVDEAAGVIGLEYLDAEDGSPVLDIKPYTPSVDRVAAPVTPPWCAHWPQSVEASGEFDWEAEFNF